jgi:ceroid-lipofuscinosis MFS transporter 7
MIYSEPRRHLILQDPVIGYGSGALLTINHRTAVDLEHEQVDDTFSYVILLMCCFIGDTARGLMMPTLWPFVSSMGGNLVWQGLIVAAFSLGRVISSPIFGALADAYGYKWVLAGCNLIIVCGSLLYSQSSTLGELFVSQLIIGIGTGTLGVTRGYVAENSTKRDRTVKVVLLVYEFLPPNCLKLLF